MRKMLYIYIAIILVLIFSSRTIYNFSLPRVTAAAPQSGWLTQELEMRGVIEFTETFYVLATSNGWVDEIFIQPGDEIDKNAVIITYCTMSNTTNADIENLGIDVERAKINLAALNLNKSNIQSNLRALTTVSSELHLLEWAVEDATEALEVRHAELADAQQAATLIAKNFDDYIYQHHILEASIILARRTTDLHEAEAALSAIIRSTIANFDRHHYQNAIDTAMATHERRIEDYDSANWRYWDARHRLYALVLMGAYDSEIVAAENSVNAAQTLLISARRSHDDAYTALNLATEAMRRAERAFNANNQDSREQAIAEAEAHVVQTTNNLADATRAYENAHSTLNRAKNTAAEASQKRVEAALETLNNVEASLTSAHRQLERAKFNLDLAQQAQTSQADDTRHALQLELQQVELKISSAEIDLRTAQSAYSAAISGNMTSITAREQGTVISVGVRAGQFVSRGDIIATVGVGTGSFMLEISTTVSDAGFIEVGDEATIIVSGPAPNITATVSDIRPKGETLTIRIIAQTGQLNGGEYVRVRFRKTSTHQMLVPNQAITVTPLGQAYVWVLGSRPGTLGTEYFTMRINVVIYASDSSYSAISRGLEMFWGAPVITSYSRPLSVNGRVGRMESGPSPRV